MPEGQRPSPNEVATRPARDGRAVKPLLSRRELDNRNRRKHPWAKQGVLPPDIERVDAARGGTDKARRVDSLLPPVELIHSEVVTDEVLDRLRGGFMPWWRNREREMDRDDREALLRATKEWERKIISDDREVKNKAEEEGIKVPPGNKRMSIQEAFELQVHTYAAVVGGVEHAFVDEPTLDHIVLNHDLDNYAGVALENPRKREGIASDHDDLLSTRDMDEETMDFEEKVNLADRYSRWSWNPAWIQAVSDINTKYKDDPHRKVDQKILSTLDQEGLNRHFRKRVQRVLPGIFKPEDIMSSTDGVAHEMIPEIVAAKEVTTSPEGEVMRKGRRVKRTTIRQALNQVDASGRLREVNIHGVILDTDKDSFLTDYETKLIMMGIQLDKLLIEGLHEKGIHLDKIDPELLAGIDPAIINDIVRRKKVMLADDSVLPTQGHPGTELIRVPRFRVPNGPDATDYEYHDPEAPISIETARQRIKAIREKEERRRAA